MTRAKMNKLASQLKTMYLTENPINFTDDDREYKYFLCFHNTHKIVRKAYNIPDMIEILQDVLANGVEEESYSFY